MSERTRPDRSSGWPGRCARERLLIRPVTPDDFGRLYEIRAIPEVTRWLTGRPASSEPRRPRPSRDVRESRAIWQ